MYATEVFKSLRNLAFFFEKLLRVLFSREQLRIADRRQKEISSAERFFENTNIWTFLVRSIIRGLH